MIAMLFGPQYAALWADLAVLALLAAAALCSHLGAGEQGPSGEGACAGLPIPLRSPRIEVSKSQRTVSVFDERGLLKTYRCCTGRAAGDKEREGDLKTPEGLFFVCTRNPESKYTRSLGLSYPNAEHAAQRPARGTHHARAIRGADRGESQNERMAE